MKTLFQDRSFFGVFLSLVMACMGGRAHAATHTWQGPANGNWSVAANWNTGVPTSGESGGTIVSFGSNTSSVMNISGLVVDQVLFTGGGNTISGTATLGINGPNLTVNIQSDTGSNTLESSLPLNLSTGTEVEAAVTTGTLTIAGNISSAAGSDGFIVANGTTAPAGIVVFSGYTNTYTGTTYVNSGILELNSGGDNSSVPGPLSIGSSGNPAVVRLLQPLEIATASAVTIETNATLDLNGYAQTIGTLTGAGSVSLGASGHGALTVGTNTAFAFAGVFSGNGTVAKTGSGTMTFTGTNDNTGLMWVEQGELDLNSPVGGSTWPGSLQIGDGLGAAGSVKVVMLANVQFNSNTAVTIEADGVLNMNNFSSATGPVTINGGSVALGSGVLDVGLLAMTGGAISTSTGGTLDLTGDLSATSSSTGTALIAASVSLNSASRMITVTPGVSAAPELTIEGVISDGSVAPSGFTKEGAGTLYLNGGANTFTGVTTVDRGTLTMISSDVSVPGALVIGNNTDAANSAIVQELDNQDIALNSSVQINASGEFDLNNHADIIASLSGTGGVALTGTASLRVGEGNASSTFNGVFTGPGTFYKTGTGTVTLGGLNHFDENSTVVAGGTLLLNGELDQDNTANVSSGATFGGTGSFEGAGGVVTASGGIIAPGGASPGVLNIGTADLSLGGILKIRINDTSGQFSDDLSTGDIMLASSTLALSVTGAPSRNAYIIADYDSLTGVFANVTGLPGGYVLNYAYTDGNRLMHIALVVPGFVSTGAASNVQGASAKLNGTINPGGKTTSYYFDYRIGDGPSSRTPVVTGLTGSSTKAVSATVSGLASGTRYEYQLVATNSGGPASGGEVVFTTLGPQVYTSPATGILGLSATLNGSANPEGSATTAWFEYGPTPGLGLKTPAQSIGNGSAGVNVAVPVTGLGSGKPYYFRIASSNASGTSRGELHIFTTLTVLPPVFTALPANEIIAQTGSAKTFTVSAKEGSLVATGAPLTYQWSKNGAPIAGATTASYTIASATLSQAGLYTCVVKNAGGSVSASVQLGVVDGTARTLALPAGKAASITVGAAGNGLTYQWEGNSGPISGAQAKTLTFQALQLSDAGNYRCYALAPGASAPSGNITLIVYDAAPIILNPVAMPHGIVGGSYSFQIPVDPSDNVTPTSFSATGLPAGLTLNASTGLISGRITGTAKSYTVTLKAANAKGSSSAAPSPILIVDPFPSGVAGTYNGLVARDPLPLAVANLNGGLGGALSMTITSTGSYTGKLALGAVSYPLTGVFLATVGSSSLTASSTIIPRTPPLDQLALSFATTGGTGEVTGSVTDNVPFPAVSVAFTALINPWSATANKAPLAATYTARLKITDPTLIGTDPTTTPPGATTNAVYPQGSGYATVTITTAGAVTWIGRMGDGTAPTTTYTTTMAQNGTFPAHLLLDGGHGACQGIVTASPDTGATNNGLPLLDGVLDWNKTGAASATDHTYANGIPLINLTIAGGQYKAPAAGSPVLGITATSVGTNNARLVFTDGGLTTIATFPTAVAGAAMAADLGRLDLRITSTNTADLTHTVPAGNPTGLSFALNTATGAMSGSFTLKDAAVTRKVSYYGLLVPRLSVNQGVGYFLLPELPATSTSPILSGQVLLEKGP